MSVSTVCNFNLNFNLNLNWQLLGYDVLKLVQWYHEVHRTHELEQIVCNQIKSMKRMNILIPLEHEIDYYHGNVSYELLFEPHRRDQENELHLFRPNGSIFSSDLLLVQVQLEIEDSAEILIINISECYFCDRIKLQYGCPLCSLL